MSVKKGTAAAIYNPATALVEKFGTKDVKDIYSVLSPVQSYIGAAVTGKTKEYKRTTFGRMFQQPTTKFPETKGAATAEGQQVVTAASESAMMAAKEKEKKRLRAAAGRKSLIATSGRGVLEEAPTAKKKLLGE